MRKWLIALTALVVVVLGADFGLRLLAAYSVERGLQSAFSLSERPSVSMGGFPFIPELVTGNVDSMTMRANGSSSEDRVSLESVMLTFHDVSFPPGQLLVGGRTRISAMSGEGTAELMEEDFNRAVNASVPATIHFRHDRVAIRWDQIEQEIVATASISDASVVLQPVEPSLPLVSVDLPKLVKGMTYREVRIEPDVATLSFTLRRAVFEIGRS